MNNVIQAVKSKEVDGMLLDRFTASYYQTRGKLKSLLTVKKLELQRATGVLFSKDREFLARCLNFYRSNILRSAQTFIDTYKVRFDWCTCLSFSPGLHRHGTLAHDQKVTYFETKSERAL